MCAIVLRKHPGCGTIRRGAAKQTLINNVFEHFWIEKPDGTVLDPANMSLPVPVPLEYDVESSAPQKHEDNDTLWQKVQDGSMFKDWDKESMRRLKRV